MFYVWLLKHPAWCSAYAACVLVTVTALLWPLARARDAKPIDDMSTAAYIVSCANKGRDTILIYERATRQLTPLACAEDDTTSRPRRRQQEV